MENNIGIKLCWGVIALLFWAGCATNVLVLPRAVDERISLGFEEIADEPKPIIYAQIGRRDDGSHQILLTYVYRATTNLRRLIRRSGRKVVIGGKRIPLVAWEDEELSRLAIPRGQQPVFTARLMFFDGPWVSWLGTQITGSWLDEKQPE